MAERSQAKWDASRAEVKAEAAEVIKANAAEALATLNERRKAAGMPLLPSPAAPVVETEAEVTEYDDFTVAELAEALKERELPHSGNKGDLIARLVEDDNSEDE